MMQTILYSASVTLQATALKNLPKLEEAMHWMLNHKEKVEFLMNLMPRQ